LFCTRIVAQLLLLLLLRLLTLVVAEDTKEVVGGDPGEDALLLTRQDARAVF